MKEKKQFQLSKEGVAFVKKEMARYETKRSALLPCLYRVQKENGGWVPEEAVPILSKIMKLPEAYINEALTFYTLYNRKPVGKLHIQVCCNLSCALNGASEIVQKLRKHFNIRKGEVSSDGLASVSCVECLGACDQAPMAQVNSDYIGPLKPETAIEQVTRGRTINGT